ncbi:MAG TPA: ELM1/GtrOC1 family putative glycosyltransferase [Candidatus Omnitrophota bacterium]|nr:ELM1/GtrOC1 family putative glycosyltransferase [Candidatus Omnitrophota bacterium]
MEDWKDRIASGVVRLLIFFFEHIPIEKGLRIGNFLGRTVFFLSGKRRVAYINLKAALGEQFTPRERWRMIRNHFGHAGQAIVETMSFRKMDRRYVDQNITVHHLERFEALLKSGHGGVLITGHFGNWELLQVVSGLRGSPIHVLAADQKYPRLNELLNKLRESHGAVAVSRGVGVRALIRALREKQLIGVLGDQSAGKTEGIIVPFFGRKTTVPTGAFELAQRTNALILPCFMVRQQGAKHEIFVGETLKDDLTLETQARVEYQIRQYLNILEEFIRRFPDQWLWENKRWKYSWNRKMLILSDGKAGHFKQSEVVAELLSDFKEFHGRPGLEFETERIHVEYRSEWHRKIFFFLAFLMRPWIQGRLHWLRPFFTEETQKAVEKANADFIIAAGSGLAALQMCLAKETGAKKIVIMKPPFPYSMTHYDLSIVPAHDGGKVPKNTFRCVIMPSGYQTHDREQDVQQLKQRLGDTERVNMAVFVGGMAHDFCLTISDAEKLCAALNRVTAHVGEFMVTTSRRTPAPVETFFKKNLSHHPACRLLVIANEDNPSYAAGGMLGLADLLIVTEDSLAMISEAVGTGKRVIVVSLGEGDLPEKHYRFHKILGQRGLVTISCLEDLEKNIMELLKKPASPVVQREKNALIQRLGTLL